MPPQSRDLERLKAHLRQILSQLPTRQVDEMALALMSVAELGDDDYCSLALLGAGFRGSTIARHLDEARARARSARAGEIDLWASTQWTRSEQP